MANAKAALKVAKPVFLLTHAMGIAWLVLKEYKITVDVTKGKGYYQVETALLVRYLTVNSATMIIRGAKNVLPPLESIQSLINVSLAQILNAFPALKITLLVFHVPLNFQLKWVPALNAQLMGAYLAAQTKMSALLASQEKA